jgi:hypothetical protein
MKSVGQDADRSAELAENDLGQRHGEIQEQYSEEDNADFVESRFSPHGRDGTAEW